MTKKKETCFVIGPIGENGSETRKRSDQILKHIIKASIDQEKYEILRADDIAEPGIITSQIMKHLVEDTIVIADLTDHNPNVYYELSLRHALKKPVILMIHSLSEKLPFDISLARTIKFEFGNMDSVEDAKQNLKNQLSAIEDNPKQFDNPISIAFDINSFSGSENPQDLLNFEIMEMLKEIRLGVQKLKLDGLKVIDTTSFDTDFVKKMNKYFSIESERLGLKSSISLDRNIMMPRGISPVEDQEDPEDK